MKGPQITCMVHAARLTLPPRWLTRAVACALACELVAVQLLHAHGARLAYGAVAFDLALIAGVAQFAMRERVYVDDPGAFVAAVAARLPRTRVD